MDNSDRNGPSMMRVALSVLAVVGGLTLFFTFVVLLTQEDLAREVVRAVSPLLTLPVALCMLAALVGVAATAIAYGLGVESRQETSGRAFGLYRRSSMRRADASVTQAITSQDALSADR